MNQLTDRMPCLAMVVMATWVMMRITAEWGATMIIMDADRTEGTEGKNVKSLFGQSSDFASFCCLFDYSSRSYGGYMGSDMYGMQGYGMQRYSPYTSSGYNG